MLDPWKESYDEPRQHIKKQRHLFTEKEWRHRYIEQSFGLCGRGRRGMIWENGIKTCIISYKK